MDSMEIARLVVVRPSSGAVEAVSVSQTAYLARRAHITIILVIVFGRRLCLVVVQLARSTLFAIGVCIRHGIRVLPAGANSA